MCLCKLKYISPERAFTVFLLVMMSAKLVSSVLHTHTHTNIQICVHETHLHCNDCAQMRDRRSVGLAGRYSKFCSVSSAVLCCSELSVVTLNYLTDSSHLWGNPTDSPLCSTSLRIGRRVAGALLLEIIWQRNLAAVALAHGLYLVQRLLLQMKPIIAAE